jgi:TetR/AcrR family transcriptional regulator
MVKHTEQVSSVTEQRILEAARREFLRHGLEGTSMQQIADAAHTNKSLVHYYFRSKEKLFNQIFVQAFQNFMPKIEEILTTDIPFFEKIEKIVDNYIDLLKNNNFLPAFILHEINRNPDRLYKLMQDIRIQPEKFIKMIQLETRKDNIRINDPRHFIINILAMCIFPFVARPLLQRVFFQGNDSAYENFLMERKKEITQFVIHSISV